MERTDFTNWLSTEGGSSSDTDASENSMTRLTPRLQTAIHMIAAELLNEEVLRATRLPLLLRLAPPVGHFITATRIFRRRRQLIRDIERLFEGATPFEEVLIQLHEWFEEEVPTGFTQSVIDSIPQRAIAASDLDQNGEAACAICFADVTVGEMIAELPCGHWFHHEDIATWFKRKNSCPTCREKFTAEQVVTGSRKNGNSENSDGKDGSAAPSGSGAVTEDKSSAVA